ncbi:hypothetical protein KUCAC02_015125 [Chaenocephalus aceratus]|uniref:Uncharacterized protein n=1 Tax=Chaenocephalus aceratus TaxID=36190 RepID=A0ACB9XYU5_CHAAC|nr:hypothetical protein KUCAC02_015125 [Chaenocephalus aceratus]
MEVDEETRVHFLLQLLWKPTCTANLIISAKYFDIGRGFKETDVNLLGLERLTMVVLLSVCSRGEVVVFSAGLSGLERL